NNQAKKKTLGGLFYLCVYTESLSHDGADLGWGFSYMNAVFPHDSHFSFRGVIGTAYNGACMPHSSAWRCCLSCNKSYNRLFVTIFPDPTGCFRFVVTSDLTDHDNGICLGIFHQQLNGLLGRSTDDRVAPDTDGGGNAQTSFRDLVSRFIGKRTGLGNNPNPSFSKDKTRHDTYFGFTWSNDAGAVGADQGSAPFLDIRLYLQHILHRNPLCNGNNHFNTCLGRLHNGICRKSRRNKNNGSVGTGSLNRILNGIKNGSIKVFAPSFARSDATYYICTVFYHLLCME